MTRWCFALVSLFTLSACASSAEDATGTEGSSGAVGEAGTTTVDAGATSSSGVDGGPSTGHQESSGSSGATSTTDTSETTAGDDSSTGEPPLLGPGCPDALPQSWVLCEDFESEPGFGDFWTNDSAMAVEEGPSTSGERSLRISHNVGQYGSGMADLRFGAGPQGGTIYEPDAEFREVWVRFMLRTHEDWPADAGISEGVEVMSLVGNNRSIAVDATIYSPDTAEARFLPWSCVHDSQLLCSSGNGDWGNPDLRTLANELGSSPLYGDERAGQWQCHEMHVRLDEPGLADGVLEFWVDDALEVSIEGLEYVGAWDGAGLNNVRFASFWSDQVGLDHHIDDVVVATAPIGCPQR